MSLDGEEVELLVTLLSSLPHVFRNRGTQNDLNFILSHLKQAIVYRGVSMDIQRLLIDLLMPLSKFKAGFMDIGELNVIMQEAARMVRQPTSPIQKVSSLSELKSLATSIHRVSRDKSSIVKSSFMQPSSAHSRACSDTKIVQTTKGIVYSRDVLLELKDLCRNHAPFDILQAISEFKLSPNKSPTSSTVINPSVTVSSIINPSDTTSSANPSVTNNSTVPHINPSVKSLSENSKTSRSCCTPKSPPPTSPDDLNFLETPPTVPKINSGSHVINSGSHVIKEWRPMQNWVPLKSIKRYKEYRRSDSE